MDWQTAYLHALGIKPTTEARARLDQWQKFEGGDTNNSAKFNFMNTKLSLPGSYDAIGNGVQGYRTLGQGALAFSKTLRGRSDYAPLVQWLKSGGGDPSAALQVWVSGQPTGNPGYAAKVLGSSSGEGEAGSALTAAGDASEVAGPRPASLDAIRAQAADGFAQIAQGKAGPEDTFAPLLDTLKAAGQTVPGANALPSVDIPGNSKIERQAAALVQKYIGVKYTWGGTSPDSGFDCSGLVQYVYRSLGVNIPRTTYEQWDKGNPVDQGDLQPGDEVFFTGSDPQNGKPGHEGLYVGNGMFIEAPHTGTSVRVSKLSDRSDFVGARRFA